MPRSTSFGADDAQRRGRDQRNAWGQGRGLPEWEMDPVGGKEREYCNAENDRHNALRFFSAGVAASKSPTRFERERFRQVAAKEKPKPKYVTSMLAIAGKTIQRAYSAKEMEKRFATTMLMGLLINSAPTRFAT